MKKKNEETEKNIFEEIEQKKITRKEALKKSGYVALTAATMMILLTTPKKAAASPAQPTIWP